MQEIWKDIAGYEGLYQISNLGNVKSLYYRGNNIEKELKYGKSSTGYYYVILSNNKIKKSFTIHRLVAQAFVFNIDNKPFVNHINAIKTDNRVDNLEWCTPKENVLHAAKLGLNIKKPNRGEMHGRAKLTKTQVIEIRNDDRTQKEIANDYGVNPSLIYFIKSKKIWAHI